MSMTKHSRAKVDKENDRFQLIAKLAVKIKISNLQRELIALDLTSSHL